MYSMFRVACTSIATFIAMHSYADVYDDYAASNRRIFLINICEVGAEFYKDYSVKVSDKFSIVLQNSKPNTQDRKNMLSAFYGWVEESDNKDYQIRKVVANRVGEGNTPRTELAYQSLTSVRQIAYSTGVNQPGKSAAYYQRSIEEDCKVKVVK
jgi:hypothetical protein